MRSGLRWLLAATLLLTGLALWWPDDAGRFVAGRGADDRISDLDRRPAPASESGSPASPVSEHLATTHFEAAHFDPFAGAQPPPPPAPKPVTVPVAALAPVPPPPVPQPQAPPLNYRYLGQMSDPSGAMRVYLAKADTAVAVTIGTQLEEGYIVQTIDSSGIRLHYPPLDAHAVIPVPPAPDPSTR